MKKIIHHIRQQPERVRRHILHVFTLVAGVLLFSIWIYSLGGHLSSAETKKDVEQGLKPFSVIKDNIRESW